MSQGITAFTLHHIIETTTRNARLPIHRIDFNCDLGEGYDDAAVMPYISSASIACGFHAGDPLLMQRTIRLCIEHDVAIGAHPSLADRENFGRRAMAISAEETYALTLYQIGALVALAKAAGARLRHVKPHGALYNMAATDAVLAEAIARAVRDADDRLILFGLAGSALTAAGERIGLRVAHEVFAERRYEADGTLTPRSHADAQIHDVSSAVAQVRQILREGSVTARTGERVALRADTLCLHGDRLDAAEFARALRESLIAEGIQVMAPGESR